MLEKLPVAPTGLLQLTSKLLKRIQNVWSPRAGKLQLATSAAVLTMSFFANVLLVLWRLDLLPGSCRRHWIACLHVHNVQHALDVALLASLDDRVLESPIARSQEDLGLLTQRRIDPHWNVFVQLAVEPMYVFKRTGSQRIVNVNDHLQTQPTMNEHHRLCPALLEP